MNRHLFAKFATPLFVCLCLLPAGAVDWQVPENLTKALARTSERDALLKSLSELDGESLKGQASLIGRFMPGGDLAGWASSDEQAVMMKLWAMAGDQGSKVAYRLWRIHQLTPNEALKKASLEALKTLPEASWPEGAAGNLASGAASIDPEKMVRGKAVYMRVGICNTCHQPNGEGIPLAFPPLAGSEWLDGDTDRQIKIVLKGLMGKIDVKGQPFNGMMTPLELMLKDDEIADVLTYVRNEWGNVGPQVSAEQVKAIRESIKGQALPYQAADLLKEHPLRK